jgi:hypothetical protein
MNGTEGLKTFSPFGQIIDTEDTTMKKTTMNKTLKLASWLLATALFAMPFTLFAQAADDDQSDTAIATDVAGKIVEQGTGLPTSLKSAVTMGLERVTGFPVDSAIEAGALKAGMSEAAAAVLSGAVAGFIAASAPSSIATDEEEGSPYQMEQQAIQAQEAQAANEFYLSHQADIEQAYSQSLRNPKPPATGPQITVCRAFCNK